MKSTYKVFGQFVKMSAIDKAKFKASIELFYINYKYFKAACVLCWKLVRKVQRMLNS